MPMPKEYHFEVQGAPRGQARHRSRGMQITTKSGKTKLIAQVYKDPEQRGIEDELRGAIRRHAPRRPHTGPIEMYLVAYYPIPQSWSKKKRAAAIAGEIRPFKAKPDISNVVKHLEDVMEGLFFVNDKQICGGFQKKFYSESPRVKIALLCEDAEG